MCINAHETLALVCNFVLQVAFRQRIAINVGWYAKWKVELLGYAKKTKVAPRKYQIVLLEDQVRAKFILYIILDSCCDLSLYIHEPHQIDR